MSADLPANNPGVVTDWTTYYQSVPAIARVTRRFTALTLMRFLRERAPRGQQPVRVLEIGGANSCFAADFEKEWPGLEYHVVDTNEVGLEMFRRRFQDAPKFSAELLDVLKLADESRRVGTFDIVYSVGLIEHFDVQGTREAVRAHFALAKPTGAVLLSYPTPTRLYRATRGALEAAGAWKFPDERPLSREEVLAAVPADWRLVREQILWPLMLTQRMAVFERQAARP